MFKYPTAWQSPHRASQAGVTKLIWILLSVRALIAMVKPAQAAGQISVVVADPYGADCTTQHLVGSGPANISLGCNVNAAAIADANYQYANYPPYTFGATSASCTPFDEFNKWKFSCYVSGSGGYLHLNLSWYPGFPARTCPINSTPDNIGNPTSCICTDPLIPDASATSCVCPAGTQLNAAGTACVTPPVCPLHAHPTNLPTPPCACDTGYVWDATQTSCLPEQYTLTLNAPVGDLEPTGTTTTGNLTSKTMSVYVENQLTKQPKAGTIVRITLGVVHGTGGHDHTDPNRPKRTLTGGTFAPSANCTDVTNLPGNYDCTTGVDGKATFTFTSSEVSGTHSISASCISPVCTNSQAVAQDVKVAGLSPIPAAAPLYVLEENIGGVM